MNITARDLLIGFRFLTLSFIVQCCQSSKEEPFFTGTWQFTEKITSDELTFNTIRTLVLTRNSYDEIYIIKREDKGYVAAVIGTKGDLIPGHSSLTFILRELGTCKKDASEKCTEDVLWFGEGTQYWSDNIQYFKSNVRGDFTANETTLHLKRDLNKDGDFDDTGEDIEFQRMKPGDQ
ncbi:MAG: hypothetical protein Q8868_05850 [Bacteroidota bacterium]|nr:hypothetical protein [Bacteroidota bacterium]